MGAGGLGVLTLRSMAPIETRFDEALSGQGFAQIADRNGVALSMRYQTVWNESDFVALHDIPEFLQAAFITAEDKRFYTHDGMDWRARAQAVVQNVKCLCADRGASTISEQVVRMVIPRPRNLWTRWVEGWEAQRLEHHATKQDILEFYLNQVPYAANRRGVVQAARYYFDRDLSTLSPREMSALAVLVRSPGRFRFRDRPQTVERAISRLSARMKDEGAGVGDGAVSGLAPSAGQWDFGRPGLVVEAPHFVRFIRAQTTHRSGKLRTTLDSRLQKSVQTLLDRRMKNLAANKVHNGAVLVVDHTTGEVLVWANAGSGDKDTPGNAIDAVLVPRQPGSTLKPFVYALALEKGWSAASLIDDSPLSEAVGNGIHSYRNYSRTFYGLVTLRQALANSLNIPAVRAAQFVGAEALLAFLRKAGFDGLLQHPDFYGDGLALGNGEVTLYQLVRAYVMIGNRGVARPLRVLADADFFSGQDQNAFQGRVLREDVASLIGNILSDSSARDLEFGEGSVLDFPVQTAVKTGTSTDFRDAWAVGFNHRYVVGVWMGNLDRTPTDGVSGARGPALLLRSVFAELNRRGPTRPLYLSPALASRTVCVPVPRAGAGAVENEEKARGTARDAGQGACVERTEWFLAGAAPAAGEKAGRGVVAPLAEQETVPHLRQPTNGLRLAVDPRVPLASQAFSFRVEGAREGGKIAWSLDGKPVAVTEGAEYLWSVARGAHRLEVSFLSGDGTVFARDRADFTVH